ncbi:MAG: HlyD family efflux transporter periplasmic adaptor subunit [Phycisphaerales bacterium]
MSRRSKRLWSAAALVAFAGAAIGVSAILLGAARSGGGQPTTQRTADEPLDQGTLQRQSFDVTTIATGELEARRQIEIRNQLRNSSTIVEIVKEGAQVKTGDILVRLNADAIQTVVDEEQIRVKTAEADYAVAENNYIIQVSDNDSALRKAELAVDISELEMRQWLEGEVKSKRQANDLAVEKTHREEDRLKEKYDRAVELQKQGFLSLDEKKRTELEYLEAQAAVKTAELNKRVYNEFEFPRDEKNKLSTVAEAKAEFLRTQRKNDSQLAKAEADRSNKRDQLNLRKANLAKQLEQLDLTVIKAPSDGLVVYDTSLNRERRGSDNQPWDVGRSVPSNQRIIVLPDTSEMMASVRVHESLTGRIRKGQSVSVKIDASSGAPVPGTVDSIGVIAEGGSWMDPNLREYTVKVRLDTTGVEAAIKPSMRCEAEIFLDKVENTLAVPASAVFTEGMVRYVYVPSGSHYLRKPVRVGRRSDRYVEIAGGIADGQRVLLRQPTAGESVDQPWEKEELAAVGLTLMPDGRITPAVRRQTPGGRPRPVEQGPAAEAPAPAAPSGKPRPAAPGA